MNYRLKNGLIGLCSALILSGCYTKKTAMESLSGPDYNGRVYVKGPHYVKKKNALGIGLNIGLIGGAAYGGYALAPFESQNGAERKPIDALNAATGAVIGGGAVLLIDAIMGRNKTIVPTNFDKWVSQVNDDYRVFYEGSSFMIAKNAESYFDIQNLRDAEDYRIAFKGGPNEQKMFDIALVVLPRKDLPKLIQIYDDNPKLEDAKRRYILEAPTINDLMAAKVVYPEVDINYEDESYKRIKDDKDITFFFEYFPNSKYNTELFKGVINRVKDEDLPLYISSAPPSIDKEVIKSMKLTYIKSFKTLADILEAYKAYPETMPVEDIIAYVRDAKLLTKADDIKIVYNKMGYLKGILEDEIRNIRKLTKGQDDREYAWLMFLKDIPELNDELATEIKKAYIDEMNAVYLKSITAADWRTLDDFVRLYRGRPYSEELVAKADKEKTYYYMFSSDASLRERVEYAKENPSLFTALDDLSYKEVKELSSSRAKEYITYFVNGKYMAHVKDLHQVKSTEEMMQQSRASQQALKDAIEETMRCKLCNGSGKCRKCNGTGSTGRSFWGFSIDCSTCGGSGKCHRCEGTGKR